MGTWMLGDIAVDRVVEVEGPALPPDVLYPGAASEVIEAHRHWLEPGLLDPASGLLVISFHSFVIRTAHHVIVVDTCGGNDKSRPGKVRYHMNSHPYLDNLAAAGIVPEDVDFVLCTHLHVDHVGWNTRLLDGRWVPTFPNARYLFGRVEWEFWERQYQSPAFTDDPYYEDSILPVIEAGQAEFVDTDYQIDDGVWLEPTPGHTPGQVALHIEGGRRRAVMSGDLMHTALQCAEPDLSSCFCVAPALSARTRRAFLERHADTDTLIMPAHFPTPSVGLIKPAGAAFRFAFA